jgi:hypothetical protein
MPNPWIARGEAGGAWLSKRSLAEHTTDHARAAARVEKRAALRYH